jgi:hypothetical protein
MEAKKKFPKNPVWVNAQKSLTKSDEADDMQKRIWRELMHLHAIDKEKPIKEFVTGRDKPRRRKVRNIT